MTNVTLTMLREAKIEVKTELMEVINRLFAKVESLEKDNREFRREIDRLKDENKQLIMQQVTSKFDELKTNEGETASNSAMNVNNWANVTAKNIKKPVEQLIVVNAAINESRDRERRKKNVVVFGLAESAKLVGIEKALEDKTKVEKIINETGASAVVTFVKRLRSVGSKPGPVLVGLSEAADRNPLLLKAKKLREKDEFKNVYICPDLTEAERMEDRSLRQKRDEMNKSRKENEPFRYAIRGNQIVKFRTETIKAAGRNTNNQ